MTVHTAGNMLPTFFCQCSCDFANCQWLIFRKRWKYSCKRCRWLLFATSHLLLLKLALHYSFYLSLIASGFHKFTLHLFRFYVRQGVAFIATTNEVSLVLFRLDLIGLLISKVYCLKLNWQKFERYETFCKRLL